LHLIMKFRINWPFTLCCIMVTNRERTKNRRMALDYQSILKNIKKGYSLVKHSLFLVVSFIETNSM